MKKIKFVIFFLFATYTVYSQIKVNNTEKEYLNNSLWSQILNDFEGQLTIPIITPWVIGVGTVNYIKDDVFTKNMLKEYNLFSGENIEFREVTNAINTSFVNYIPKDSTLRMRAKYNNRILYTFEMSNADTTQLVDFSIPSKNNTEKIVFDRNGSLLTYNSFNNLESTSIVNRRVSDSLSICSTSYSEKIKTLIEKRQFVNGIITRKTTYKKDKVSLKESFVSDRTYKYNDKSELICMQTLNRRGEATDSISFFYDAHRLVKLLQQGVNSMNGKIVFDYSTKDTVIKEFNADDKEYYITFVSTANRISKIRFYEIQSLKSSEFDFEYNIQGLLMTVSCFYYSNEKELDITPQKQLIFNYNELQNIENVKVINRSGTITKEISFEYDYL